MTCRLCAAVAPGCSAPPLRRRVAALLVLLVASLTSIMPIAALAQTGEAAAERAANEIQDARERANAAAEAFFQAESDLDVLNVDRERLEREAAALETTVERLRADVETVAVNRFVSSGATGIPLLTGLDEPQAQLQVEVFVEVLTNTGSDALDSYDFAQKDLASTTAALESQRRNIEEQQAMFGSLRTQAEEEVVRLREIEANRLQDQAVQRVLDQRLAAERAELEAAAQLEAEAALALDPGVVLPSNSGTTTTTLTAVPVPVATADDSVDTAPEQPTAPPETAPPETVPPETAPPETAPPTTAAPTSGGIICPMPGSAYADTWGAPRSGGRSHQGVDLIAPRGIPIYAVTSGYARFSFNRLGGNAVSLAGDNGDRYYYGHLDSYAGSSRTVFQGEVIGYNGDTGNAKFSTPHLHFEIRPGGGRPVNPYPAVRAAGC